ncbi:MAG: Gfo/Idh/MocA family oxidoreductase, partial [Anaerolineae bacterium]|nr:Gfo/Idh/MocA family oxidoreductase [Anaerolineae bacterium]
MAGTLKVGIIGVGGIARTHMPGWAASEYAEVVAGCDIDEHVLQEWGRANGITRLTTHAEDLFRDPGIDIVDICTPNMYHAELTIAALDAGKHVICEKPLAPTPSEIQRMIAARDRSGKLLMTAQHFRFMGTSRALKAEIDAGALGDVYHARSWMLRRAALPARLSFVLKRHSGGGPCIDIGVHILDLTLWLMGNPKPVAVTGVARNELARHPGAFSSWGLRPVPSEMDVEDFAAAFVRFENGATLILEVSWMLHHNTMTADRQIWLYGTEGGAHWPQCEILKTNYETRQLYNQALQLTQDAMEPHALEC